MSYNNDKIKHTIYGKCTREQLYTPNGISKRLIAILCGVNDWSQVPEIEYIESHICVPNSEETTLVLKIIKFKLGYGVSYFLRHFRTNNMTIMDHITWIKYNSESENQFIGGKASIALIDYQPYKFNGVEVDTFKSIKKTEEDLLKLQQIKWKLNEEEDLTKYFKW